jgi:gliding motility-associated-like protein
MKTNYYTLILFCAFQFLFTGSIAQTNFFHIVNSPLDTILCNSDCILLSTQHLDIKKTSSYNAYSIPFTPSNLTSGNFVNVSLNQFSDTIPLGFEFCFYGNIYNHCYVSLNGHLTFNDSFRFQNATFETQHPLPYTNSTFPDNAIFLPFGDFDLLPSTTVKYGTIDTAPFRKFIIQYDSLAFFQGGTCSNNLLTSMRCELNETYNTIEIYIASKPLCDTNPGNWLNYATIGLQSIGAMNYKTVLGKNASIWTASNQAWQFSPAGLPDTKVDWYDENGNLLQASSDTINFCSSFFPRKVKAKIEYLCPYKVYWDSIKIVKLLPHIDSVLIDSATCQNTMDGGVAVFGSSFYPPLQYSLDYGVFGNSNSFNNLGWGYHYVIIKDSLGCEDTLEIFIPVKSNLSVFPLDIDTPFCQQNNGKICDTVTGGVPPYTYLWSTGDTTNCIFNLVDTVYKLIVTDAIGCEAYHIVDLPALQSPIVQAVITHPVCNTNGVIDISVTNGFAPYTYAWNNGSTNQDLSGLSAGSYTLTVKDSVDCEVISIFYLLNNQVMDSFTNIVYTTCGLNNGSLSIVGYDGTPPYSFLWSTGSTATTTTNLSAGWYTCTITDATNCTNSATFFLPPSNPLQIQFSVANANCSSQNNGKIFTTLQNATLPCTYSWSNFQTTSDISGLVSGYYTCTVYDDVGCIAIDSVFVGIDSFPILSILSYTQPLCVGDSNGSVIFGGLHGAPPYIFSFDGINYTISTQLNGISAGVYTVFIKDANSCLSDTIITLSSPDPLIFASLYADTNACYDDADASLFVQAAGGTPNYQYQLNSSGWQSSNIFSGLASGLYQLQIKDSHGCLSSTNYEVLGPKEALSFLKNKLDLDCYIDNSGVINYTILGGWPPYKIEWDQDTSTSTLRNNLHEGMHKIFITDNLGCQIEDTTYVGREECCHVYFPNAFSPNHDGINDIFKPISIKDIQAMLIKIYDRWGNMVFESHDYNKGWDGTIKNAFAESATYFYLVKYICNITSKVITLKGDIMIIR